MQNKFDNLENFKRSENLGSEGVGVMIGTGGY